ncbi:MAG TPA: NAD(P)/FAD-dependent oxidoreductase [Chloroflexota bacterium]|nr:NAD(P)/FAD-dependent oxidoreductase [Chloroflexota bacterium]
MPALRRARAARHPRPGVLRKTETHAGTSLTTTSQPHVVVVGAGFAGLYAARALARRPVRVTVVDRQNHHVFTPLLYQVATAALSPGEIAQPVRALLRDHPNVRVLMADVTAIDPQRKCVRIEGQAANDTLEYDYLILAAGGRHAYFGHDEWERFAPGLKTIDDALELRRRFLRAYEAAEEEPDAARRREWLTFVLIGGGPTGVELAGTMAEIARHTLSREYRAIDPADSRILLLEAGQRILPGFSDRLSASAQRQLERLGVQVRTNALVTGVDEHGVAIGEERIAARTVFWAAGVAASPLARTLGAPLDKAGRVLVEPDLSAPGDAHVFVAGDLAAFTHQPRAGSRPLPGVAQVAIQQGKAAAENVWRSIQGRPTEPFRYKDLGSMATIGRAAAVADLTPIRLQLSGWAAWLAWLLVHIAWLIGFQNRLIVLLRWAWAYVTFRRAARLITGAPPADAR